MFLRNCMAPINLLREPYSIREPDYLGVYFWGSLIFVKSHERNLHSNDIICMTIASGLYQIVKTSLLPVFKGPGQAPTALKSCDLFFFRFAAPPTRRLFKTATFHHASHLNSAKDRIPQVRLSLCEHGLQSRLPQQATSRKQSGVRIARRHSAQGIQPAQLVFVQSQSDSRTDCPHQPDVRAWMLWTFRTHW